MQKYTHPNLTNLWQRRPYLKRRRTGQILKKSKRKNIEEMEKRKNTLIFSLGGKKVSVVS